MFKIKDRITLGSLCASVGVLPWRWSNMLQYKMGWTDARYDQHAASLFFPKGAVEDPAATIIGRITNWLMIVNTGVATTYLLSATGKDKAVLKGIGVASTFWLALYGFYMNRGAITAKPKKKWSPLLSFIDHVGFGTTNALLISKLGDDSLFPKQQLKEGQQLPLVGEASQHKREGVDIHNHLR